jgi:hypothetical protein
VSRLQNVVVSVMLVCGYAAKLFAFARDIGPDVVVRALEAKSAIFPSLPDPGGTFTTLLTASHATYLVAKQASSELTIEARDGCEREEFQLNFLPIACRLRPAADVAGLTGPSHPRPPASRPERSGSTIEISDKVRLNLEKFV